MRRASLAAALTVAALAVTAQAAFGAVREVDVPAFQLAFTPAAAIAVAGDDVKWVNNSASNHTVTFTSGPAIDKPLGPGATVTSPQPFTLPAGVASKTYAYHCKIHASMTGTVSVYGLYFHPVRAVIVSGSYFSIRGLARDGVTTVTIQQKNGPTTHVTPAADGSFTKRVRLTAPTTFTATDGAYTTVARAHVMPKLSIAATRVSGHKFHIATSASPGQPGATVRLERWASYRWVKVAAKTLTSRSRATFTARFRKKTKIRVRETHAVGGFTPGTTRAIRVGP